MGSCVSNLKAGSNPDNPCLFKLPNEVFDHILSFLPKSKLGEFAVFRLVDRRWNAVVKKFIDSVEKEIVVRCTMTPTSTTLRIPKFRNFKTSLNLECFRYMPKQFRIRFYISTTFGSNSPTHHGKLRVDVSQISEDSRSDLVQLLDALPNIYWLSYDQSTPELLSHPKMANVRFLRCQNHFQPLANFALWRNLETLWIDLPRLRNPAPLIRIIRYVAECYYKLPKFSNVNLVRPNPASFGFLSLQGYEDFFDISEDILNLAQVWKTLDREIHFQTVLKKRDFDNLAKRFNVEVDKEAEPLIFRKKLEEKRILEAAWEPTSPLYEETGKLSIKTVGNM
ncbi:hypothetical protein L596_006951 [Steinernema carpocapsae]|uniref:F-box domain-containing protein n=2 Tax=Steinernema carpocapsae TaxID=34508 RepID=A0A4U5P866_STECR|nr:hypothetical protein L596_006951 [Steinernema carpocapsae]